MQLHKKVLKTFLRYERKDRIQRIKPYYRILDRLRIVLHQILCFSSYILRLRFAALREEPVYAKASAPHTGTVCGAVSVR